MLRLLLGDSVTVRILHMLLRAPEKEFSLTQLLSRVRTTKKFIEKEIARLEKLGVVLVRVEVVDEVESRYVRINKDFVIYEELRGIVVKEQFVARQDFVEALQNMKGLRMLILTGVFTDIESAVDMVLVGKIAKDDLEKLLRKFTPHFNRHIRYTVLTEDEYRYRMEVTDRFLYDVVSGKHIVLVDTIHQRL